MIPARCTAPPAAVCARAAGTFPAHFSACREAKRSVSQKVAPLAPGRSSLLAHRVGSLVKSALSSNSVAVHLEHSPPGSLGAKSHPNCDFQCSSGSPRGRKKIRTPYPGIRDPTRAELAGSLSRIPPTLPRRCVCLSALSALDPVTAPKLSATEVGTPWGHAAA